MQKEYYLNKLYPFQNEIFDIINNLKVNLYLTGGTALSRFYLNHRYSDDLDFFANDSKTFLPDTELIIKIIQERYTVKILKKANDFIRLIAEKESIELKIDFVNDVPYRSGKSIEFPEFKKVDNWWNILTNKLTAIERNEPKDIADILFLWRKNKIEWGKAFDEASKKVNYIDPLDVSVTLATLPIENLEKINWVSIIDIEKANIDIKSIAKEILLNKSNKVTK